MSAPTLAEVLRSAIASALENVHTAIPGRVTRYDAGKQQADVQPLLKIAFEDEDGNRVSESLPVVRNCPVQFGGGGGLTITFPVAVGDTGLLVFSEASLDKWLEGDGREVDPDLDLRMSLTDGIFIPGVKPFGASRAVPSGVIAIGRDGGEFQPAVLGDGLKWWLQNHAHPPAGGVPIAPFPSMLDANLNGDTPPQKIFSDTVKIGDDPV